MGKMAVVDGAYIQCAAGTHIPQLTVTPNNTEIENYNVASVADSKKGENIKPFGICAFTQKPCDPQIHGQWWPGEPSVLLGNDEVVLDTESILFCDVGGVIAVVEQGQISVSLDSPELAYKDPDAPHGLWTWIPIVGSEGEAGYAAGKGESGKAGIYHGLALFDALTLGLGSIPKKGAQEGGEAALRRAALMRAGSLLAGRATRGRLLAGKTTRQIFAEARARAQELRRVFKERGREAFQKAKKKLTEEGGFAEIGPRKLPGPRFKTSKEAAQKVKELPGNFRKIKERSRTNQAIYTDGKRYISRDADGHTGGAWKVGKSVKEINSKRNRSGTYDENLNRIGK